MRSDEKSGKGEKVEKYPYCMAISPAHPLACSSPHARARRHARPIRGTPEENAKVVLQASINPTSK